MGYSFNIAYTYFLTPTSIADDSMSGQNCGSKADVNAARQVVNGSDWAALPNQESRNKTIITAVKATATAKFLRTASTLMPLQFQCNALTVYNGYKLGAILEVSTKSNWTLQG